MRRATRRAGAPRTRGTAPAPRRWRPRAGRGRWAGRGSRRAVGRDEMIISLYAGGMTVRDIQHHLARTIGTELSHDTISNITDAVAEEVKAWQARPLGEVSPAI